MSRGTAVSQEIIDKYGSYAEAASGRYGIPKEVILAVINTESDGNASAQATNGQNGQAQVGLMQVGAGALSDVQKFYGDNVILVGTQAKKISELTMADMKDANANIQVSTAYIKVCADNYTDGTIGGALTYYGDRTPTYASDVIKSANLLKSGVVSSTSSAGAGRVAPSADGAAATNPSNAANVIMKFARFAETKAFLTTMSNMFTQSMTDTLHGYLSNFMSKFYHNLYYVPTLPDNFAIIVKPECCFVEVPACNVIYPSIKSDISYVRDAKSEPTRLINLTNPLSNIFGVTSDPITQLVTMAFIDEVDGKPTVKSLDAMKVAYDIAKDLKHPQNNLTEFEKKNGIRILREARGEDIFLYLASNNEQTSTAGTTSHYVLTDKSQAEDICKTLGRLAEYSLLRSRYEARQGNVSMVANPYIMPGFPMLSVEGSGDSSMNLYGYVNSVTHSISDSSWTTSASFNCAHIASEERPDAFPIAEVEYSEVIESTYKDMLGNAMTKVDKATGADECRTAYNNSDKSVTSMLKRIWRPLTTREQHLTEICDGATVVEADKYTWFQNGSGKSFFDESVQAKIKQYTSDILAGNAMYTSDVR